MNENYIAMNLGGLKLTAFLLLMVITFELGVADNGPKVDSDCWCYEDFSNSSSRRAEIYCNFEGRNDSENIRILSNATSSPDAIIYLYIENYVTKNLSNRLFEGLKIDYLKIEFSKIDKIDDGAFKGLEKYLTYISFKSTDIVDFKTKAFSNLKSLNTFSMESSNIRKIRKEEMDGFVGSSLSSLILEHNHIKEIEEGAFSSLSIAYLDLSGNEISELPECFNRNLSIMFLGDNTFTELPFKALKDATNFPIVYLYGNEIKHIKEEEIEVLVNLGYNMYLSDNPLECGCDMEWITKKFYMEDKVGVYGLCEGNNARNRYRLDQLIEEDFYDCYEL